MNASATDGSRRSLAVADWAPPIALLLGTVVIGGALGGLIRPLFVLGCGAVGVYAWRRGPAAHFYSILLLFAFAPFARRVVDVQIGFDYSSLMLVGPLLAIIITGPDVLRHLFSGGSNNRLAPIFIVALCVAYAVILTIAQGNWSDAISNTLKWSAPLVYGAALAINARNDDILDAAISAFAIILPITGAYAIYQYVDPPEWDRFWMQYASIMSAGQPVPYGVRSFSTLNGPASYATFTAAGLLLTFFLRRSWLSILIMLPAFMGLLLSQYRTAWIAVGAGLLFCLLFNATRLRASLVIVGAIGLGLLALTIPPFSDVIGDRIASFTQGGQDGSAQERLQQYVTLWAEPDASLFGIGFSTVDVGTAGAMAVDGMIIACWLAMGIPVGILCLFAFVWAASLPVIDAFRVRSAEAIVVGAFGIGALSQIPLANLGSGELGMLFWSIIVQTPLSRHLSHVRPPGPDIAQYPTVSPYWR